jgi:hypothetical protein
MKTIPEEKYLYLLQQERLAVHYKECFDELVEKMEEGLELLADNK